MVLNMNIHIIILDVQYDDCCMPTCDVRNIIDTVCADKKGGNRYVAGNRTLYYYASDEKTNRLTLKRINYNNI